MTVFGTGQVEHTLSEATVAGIVHDLLADQPIDGRHVVVLIPDGTRTAPLPMMLRFLHGELAGRARRIDVLIALGTHQPMPDDAMARMVGVSGLGPESELPAMTFVNHEWWRPEAFTQLGRLSREQIEVLSEGRMHESVVVTVNSLVAEADLAIVCGPVFPHEVVGFSGGNKYFFPGVSGPELIDVSHWLGALITSRTIIGTLGTTPVRRLIDAAAAMIPTPRLCLAMVVRPGPDAALNGLYAGPPEPAWAAAAQLSARVHVRYAARTYRTVLSVLSPRYEDMWTAAKGMYKVEPVVADGGEVILYAPHITDFSVTHGDVLAAVGYHVRDYFLSHWDQFQDQPWGVLAHSTHLRGSGEIVDGVERPRISVTLATGIAPEVCRAHGLGYRDPATIDPHAWLRADDPDVLVVENAGETLYRLESER
jgi:nickel-dependent lactate racemase